MLCNAPVKHTIVPEVTPHLQCNVDAAKAAAQEIITNCKIERGSLIHLKDMTDLTEIPESVGDCRQVFG